MEYLSILNKRYRPPPSLFIFKSINRMMSCGWRLIDSQISRMNSERIISFHSSPILNFVQLRPTHILHTTYYVCLTYYTYMYNYIYRPRSTATQFFSKSPQECH